jgi:uncharacterized protein
MIHKIAIENFFSVADRQEMVLSVSKKAPGAPRFRKSQGNGSEILPVVVAVYGANASGKSTFLRAITTVAWFVRSSFGLAPDTSIPFFHPYMQRDWHARPTKISIEFDSRLSTETPPAVFRYELHLNNEWAKPGKEVAYEALSYAPKIKVRRIFRRIFERKGQEFDFGREFGITASDSRVKSIRPNASVISTLAQLNHQLSVHLLTGLQALQTNFTGFEKSPPLTNAALNFYHKNPVFLEQLNRELSRLDLGLEEMKVVAGENGPIALFKHVGLDAELVLALESTGTKKFIEVFPYLQYVLNVGGIAVIDELDNDIHPLLLPELFRWFYDEERNKQGAQLLFTAHNPAILDDLEKEQVFFTEKPSGHPTRVYGAREIQGLRRQPSLMKKYLAGELGAVPRIG